MPAKVEPTGSRPVLVSLPGGGATPPPRAEGPPGQPRPAKPPGRLGEAGSGARVWEADETRGEGDGPSKPPFVRRHPLGVLLAFLALAAAGVGGYQYWQHARRFEQTDDAFLDARAFALAPKVSGYVTEVLVDDNQHLAAGATALRIDPRDYRIALDQARAQAEAAEAQVGIFDAQIVAQAAQIAQAQAQVGQSQAAVEFADADAQRYQELVQKGAGTLQRSQQSTSDQRQRRADLARAEAALAGARRQVDVLNAQRRNAAAGLAQARAQVEQARLNLSHTDVVVRQAGRATRVSAAVGQYAQAGASVLTVVPDRVWVTANFKETQLADMRPGQPVEIRIDAYPGRAIGGRVASIQRGSGTAFSLLPAENATGNFVKVVQRVPVKIVADDWPGDLVLGPGMSVVPVVRVR